MPRYPWMDFPDDDEGAEELAEALAWCPVCDRVPQPEGCPACEDGPDGRSYELFG